MVRILMVAALAVMSGVALAGEPLTAPMPVVVVQSTPAPFPILRQMVCDGLGCRMVNVPSSSAAPVASLSSYTSSSALSACSTCGGTSTVGASATVYQPMATAEAVRFHPLQRLASLFQNRPKLFARGGGCGCGQ